MVSVLFVLQVAVCSKGSDVFPVAPFDIHVASDLDGDVAAVCIIDKILEGNDHISPHILIDAVVPVRYGYKAYSQHREYLLNVAPGFNVVSAET